MLMREKIIKKVKTRTSSFMLVVHVIYWLFNFVLLYDQKIECVVIIVHFLNTKVYMWIIWKRKKGDERTRESYQGFSLE